MKKRRAASLQLYFSQLASRLGASGRHPGPLDPSFDSVTTLGLDILDLARAAGMEPRTPVLFGALPTDNVDAMVLDAPPGGVVVAVTRGLWRLCHVLPRVVVPTLPHLDEGDERPPTSGLVRFGKVRPEGERAFVELLVALASGVPPDPLPDPVPDMDTTERVVAYALRDAAQAFALAGLCSMGVLSPPATRTWVQSPLASGVMAKRLCPSHHDQAVGDSLGLYLAVRFVGSTEADDPWAFLPTDLYLAGLGFVEAIEQGLGHPPPVRSQCPAHFRRQALRSSLLAAWGDRAMPALILGDVAFRALRDLYLRNEEEIFERVAAGIHRDRGLRAGTGRPAA